MKRVSFFTIPTKKINTIYLQPWTLLCFRITSIQSQERCSVWLWQWWWPNTSLLIGTLVAPHLPMVFTFDIAASYHLHGSIFTLLNDKSQWTARTTAETSANHITPVQALQLYQCLPWIKHTSNYQKKTKHLSTRTLLHQIQPINNPCHTKAPPFAIAPTSQRLGQHSRANCTCSLLGVWLNHVALMQDHNSVVVYEHEFLCGFRLWETKATPKKVFSCLFHKRSGTAKIILSCEHRTSGTSNKSSDSAVSFTLYAACGDGSTKS